MNPANARMQGRDEKHLSHLSMCCINQSIFYNLDKLQIVCFKLETKGQEMPPTADSLQFLKISDFMKQEPWNNLPWNFYLHSLRVLYSPSEKLC